MNTEEQQHESDRSSGPEGPEDLSRSLTFRTVALLGVVCVVVVLLFSHFVLQPFLIPSGSMEPTLQVGDRLLVDKIAYRFGGEPRRGDVVVFNGAGSFVQDVPKSNPVVGMVHGVAAAVGLDEPADTDFVKRVIGVGGDHVVCCAKDGRIEVNGHPVTEPYLYPGNPPSEVRFDIVVPPGDLWVMGDHRSDSSDSRDHLGDPGGGMVPVDRVLGRASWVGWPFSRWSSVKSTNAFKNVPAPDGPHG
jgi:signal peptidase I